MKVLGGPEHTVFIGRWWSFLSSKEAFQIIGHDRSKRESSYKGEIEDLVVISCTVASEGLRVDTLYHRPIIVPLRNQPLNLAPTETTNNRILLALAHLSTVLSAVLPGWESHKTIDVIRTSHPKA